MANEPSTFNLQPSTPIPPSAVGIIGLGNMGAPMARRLSAAGYRITVRDTDPAAQAALGGVAIGSSPAEVARQSEVVLLSLPAPAVSEAVVMGPDGIIASGARPIVIDTSTTGVPTARRIAAACREAGIPFIDSPVSGGVPGAEKGTLTLMLAGDPAVIEQVRPVLQVIGSNHFLVGSDPGQGQVIKVANNVLSATILAASIEALAVAAKAGVSPRTAIDILNVSTGRNAATETKIPEDVLSGAFSYGFATALMYKDVKLFQELADYVGMPTVVCAAGVDALRFAMNQGYGPQSLTAIAKMYEAWAGVELRETVEG